ncbi:PREDICTED: uncharacterized protein LOC105562962 [Vollenhovia emeryi]|uniref:uncharacterized protein LOC105562962 n=1 Tax=Vollenhovia emeryi TaxID=411798 RepID=UPI0005F49337|nr:PREDICTED: uncharacterized protein LOC105562962 [Vollenhovia emeryi]
MISSGFNVSADLCNHKWKNLTRSYRTAKDNKNSTGRGTCRFQFFNVMDKILGTAPSNQSTHTLSSLSNVESQDIVNSPCTSSSSMIVDDSFSLSLDSDNENSDKIINIKENNNEIRNIKENTETPSENVKQNFKRKRNDEKIALEKEKIELRKRKLAIEEEKIKLMKEFIALKKSGSL